MQVPAQPVLGGLRRDVKLSDRSSTRKIDLGVGEGGVRGGCVGGVGVWGSVVWGCGGVAGCGGVGCVCGGVWGCWGGCGGVWGWVGAGDCMTYDIDIDPKI